ncbi:MAG: prephenate dehydratase [Acidothermus sp.]|nr:prephenate dehydratase [Acidothermus sp.]MCL6537420.1 prephenate dehydratase [Acidothermus sp.]
MADVPRYAYLGPEGTFSEAALRTLPEAETAELIPYRSVATALDAVRRGEADAALVPLENSVGGAVDSTIDELSSGELLHITREVLLDVGFAFALGPERTRDRVRRVAAHPQAEAQCRRWIAEKLPTVEIIPAASNADAAAMVAAGRDNLDAAITSALAAKRYGLSIVDDDIHDHGHSVTRFVLLRRPGPPMPRTGADKTSLVAWIGDDHPGALLEVLTEFAVRGINLTWIESRPAGSKLGRYSFSIDCEGHVADARVGEALMGLRRICAAVRFLGSYPRADGIGPTTRPGTSDADFAEAARWLEKVRAGVVDEEIPEL